MTASLATLLRRPPLAAVVALVMALAVPAAASADPWWKVDTHVHSSVSGDGPADLGIISKAAKDQGYDALMLTDHTATSNEAIGGVVANHIKFDDANFKDWPSARFGVPTAFTDAESTAQANVGATSLHLTSTAGTGYAEAFRWNRRGPNLRSGDIIMKFSVYPTRLDAGSSLYVSLSLGGDETITSRPPQGYTTAAGVISPGKHSVFVWQLGDGRQASTDPNARVLTHPLSYTLNQWNTYTINVSQAIRDEIPAADMPSELDAATQLKLAAGGRGGTADGYFDTYSLDASSPVPTAQEFVYRNQHVHDYDAPNFTVFPSQEVGWNRHVQQFNFGITDPSQFTLYKQGILSIVPTQQTGYPVQLNHPGLPGGVTQQEATDTLGEGADTMEVAERSDEEGYVKNVMVDTWDAVLKQGVQLLGAWSSDMHRVEKLGPATFIQAPTRSFDPLMQSMYEGRTYLALNNFTGRAIFNLDGSDDPYAARYPTYVSPSQSLANARFKITGGIQGGSHVVWTVNGSPMASDAVNGPTYDGTKTIPIGGAFTYVRAELRNAAGIRVAMSQPIFFTDTPGLLPAGMNYNVTRVTTPTGNGYTKLATKGITSSTWDAPTRALSFGLTNPAGSLVSMRASTGGLAPATLLVDGVAVPAAASASAFDTATGSSWWFDPVQRTVLVKAKQTGGTATVELDFTDGGDTTAPAAPDGLTAHAHGAERIDLAWNPSGAGDLRGYTVYRDGLAIAIVPAGTTQYTDAPLAAGTRFTYTVDAVDTAENHSAPSIARSATTDVVTVSTFVPNADSYVDESLPNNKYGTATTLRIDGSPAVRTYMRFDVSGLSGTIEKATLRLYNNSKSGGFDVHSASNSWTESLINFANAPLPSATLFGSSNGGDAGAWSTADVTPLVTANGTITAEIDTVGTSSISYSSRQGANAPQLVVETSVPSNDPPVASNRAIAAVAGIPTTWTPSVDDPDGDPVTCAIVSQPAHGTATVDSNCSSGSYTPTAGYAGTDTFTYRATDPSNANSSPATVTATVTLPNNAPTAADRTLTTNEDTQGSWTPSVSDPDSDATTCQIVSAPAHGTATVAPDCSTGTYVPATDYNGGDSFTYKATDSRGASSGTATVSTTVTPVNDAPTSANRSLTAVEDTPGSWTPSVADVEGDPLSCSIVAQPVHGTATVAPDCSSGTYTPAADYNGSDSFTYKATDASLAQSSPGTVSATVTAVNDAPTAADRTLTTNQDLAGSWTPSVADRDGDTLTCAVVSQPAHGTATVASDCSSGAYTPTAGYSGTDSFTYRASDPSNASSDPATVTATVVPTNRAPTAADRTLTTNQGTAATWSPSVNDPDGDPVSCEIVTAPAHGTATVQSNCSGGTYAPASGYSGTDSFTYRAVDSRNAQSAPATVNATIVVPPLFSDGFETGNLSAWGSSRALTVQSAIVNGGSFAARAQSTNGPNWAKRTLGGSYSDLTYRIRFRTESAAPAGAPTIMRLRSGADRALVSLYLGSTRRLGLRNDNTSTTKTSATTLSQGRWYELELHAIVNGAASSVEVRVDGVKLTDISTTTTDLGVAGIGVLQIGENNTGPAYDFVYDDVSAIRATVGAATVAALRLAPNCTSRSSVRLSGRRHQNVARTGAVEVQARSASTCAVTALAAMRGPDGRRMVASRTVKAVLPAGRRGSLSLRFSGLARQRIKQAAAQRPVFVLVYAGSIRRPIAQRKIAVGP